MKILVTGSRGMLGSEFSDAASRAGLETGALDRTLFLSLKDSERSLLLKDYDVVFHAAANTNVEACEIDPESAYYDNVFLTEEILRNVDSGTTKFVFISSTGIYGRAKQDPFNEYDDPQPTTIHHKSKVLAEQAVLRRQGSLILRAGWLFGGELNIPKNFVNNRIIEAKKSDGIVFSNAAQRGCPTYARDFAEMAIALLKVRAGGVFNVVNAGSASRFEYVKKIIELARLPIEVRPTESAAFSRVANVSANEMALSFKLRYLHMPPMRLWEEALEAYMQQKGLIE